MTTSTAREPLLSVDEAAAFMNCCQATVRRAAIRGLLRGQKVGPRWRFAPEDLRAYLARNGDDAEFVKEIVASAPPPTPQQLARLTSIFDHYLPHRD